MSENITTANSLGSKRVSRLSDEPGSEDETEDQIVLLRKMIKCVSLLDSCVQS